MLPTGEHKPAMMSAIRELVDFIGDRQLDQKLGEALNETFGQGTASTDVEGRSNAEVFEIAYQCGRPAGRGAAEGVELGVGRAVVDDERRGNLRHDAAEPRRKVLIRMERHDDRADLSASGRRIGHLLLHAALYDTG